MSQQEKFNAIKSVYPHIPTLDMSRIAQRVVLSDDLLRIGQIVTAYVRHVYTRYDDALKGKQYYSSARAEARNAIQPKVSSILSQWR